MRLVLMMALRNLARRKLRTTLTILMVAVGTSLIVFMVGLSEGAYDDLIKIATRSWTGHFQLMARGYNDKPNLFKSLADPAALLALVEKNPSIEGATIRIESPGLLAFGSKTTGAFVMGVDSEREKKVTEMAGTVTKGRWLTGGGAEAVLGAGLAKRLGVKAGDEISFVGQAADGSIAAELLTVCGIMETGFLEMDSSTAIINAAFAREALVLGNKAHRVVGSFESIDDADRPAGGLQLPDGVEYHSWRGIMPSLDRSIKSDRVGVRILLGVLLAVVILGVANTMLMVVMERTHEFGVMSALGTPPGKIVALVLAEAAWLTTLGAIIGIGAGAYANDFFSVRGIPVSSEPVAFGGVVMDRMHTTNTLFAVAGAPLIVVVCGIGAAIIPAARAARLKAAQALRKA